jgi:phosphohistidine swiveling domain-containing protein
MKQDNALFTRLFPTIKKETWYRQRFDACPHFMFFLGDAHISSIQQTKYPFGQRVTYAGFSKNRADWYHGLEELEYTASHIIEASQADPLISEKMVAEFKPYEDAFYAECLKLDGLDLAQVSNQELLSVYRNLAEIYTNKLNASPLIDGFALSTDTVIASKIKTFLEEKKVGEKFVEYFAVLTAPVFLSFLQQEEIALLEVAGKIQQDKTLADALIAVHQKHFFWIQNNYVKDHVVDVAAFQKRLAAMEIKDTAQTIREIEEIPVHNKKRKEAFVSELALPHEIKTLLKITDDFNQWQDERKKGTFWATHYFSLLLTEVANRTKYSLEQLKYAFPPELDAILSETIDPAELDKRFEYCMIVWVPGQYDVTTDTKLITELDRIGTGEHTTVHELKGFTASLGKVRGRARIIESVEEINRVEEGDIMVAVMTRPDYLPAMKKAAAFVTDEGGITCHAAIVARELKKPCIIGTKVATKILKDGDMIEVDADKGVIRIIS